MRLPAPQVCAFRFCLPWGSSQWVLFFLSSLLKARGWGEPRPNPPGTGTNALNSSGEPGRGRRARRRGFPRGSEPFLPPDSAAGAVGLRGLALLAPRRSAEGLRAVGGWREPSLKSSLEDAAARAPKRGASHARRERRPARFGPGTGRRAVLLRAFRVAVCRGPRWGSGRGHPSRAQPARILDPGGRADLVRGLDPGEAGREGWTRPSRCCGTRSSEAPPARRVPSARRAGAN